MVTKKLIKVPIYDYKITIVVTDTLEEVRELYPSLDGEVRACVLEGTNDATIIIPPNSLECVVHECVHLKNCIWRYIGQKSDIDNDEVDAYLVEYLFNEVSKVTTKHITNY